jgi:hypothetical protein
MCIGNWYPEIFIPTEFNVNQTKAKADLIGKVVTHYRFEGPKYTVAISEADFISGISPFTSIKADKRNYCWLAGFKGNSPVLHVFDGEVWESSPEGIFPDDFITTIETDNDNNIWVGTNNNGVFILNQKNDNKVDLYIFPPGPYWMRENKRI